MRESSLSGLRVLELGGMVAAPYCAKLLGDLGAEVIKIEEPRTGDPARLRGPFPADEPHPERSGLFLYLNTSKRGVTLDLTTEEGRGIFRALIAAVDVLIEDRAPGDLAGMGIGYEPLSTINPALVVTSITPFGGSGPYRDHRCHPLNLYHASGHSSQFYVSEEGKDRPPAKAGGYLGEYDAGLTAAVGTLAACISRMGSGRGQHVEVSKQEAMMNLERVDIGRLANESDPMPWRRMVGGLTRARDGYLVVTPIQNHQWQGFVRAMGDPDWAKAEWCQNELGRLEHRAEIQPHVEKWAAERTRDEIYHLLQAEGTPVGPVRNVAEVRTWPQAVDRGFFVELEHAEAGKQDYPTAAYRFSETPWRGAPAPLLGQHNEEVYCGMLGYAPEDLSRLSAAGVI